MSQSLKQNAIGRKMLQHFCRCLMGLGMAVALWNSSLFIPLAQAEYVQYTSKFIGSFTEDERNSVDTALGYINSILKRDGDSLQSIEIKVDKEKDTEGTWLAEAGSNEITINTAFSFNYDTPSQVASFNQIVDENGEPLDNLTSVLYHEMGHNLMIDSNCYGTEGGYTIEFDKDKLNEYDKNLWYNSTSIQSLVNSDNPHTCIYNNEAGDLTGIFTFRGETATSVYNDGGTIVQYVEVENGQDDLSYLKFDSGSSISHPFTDRGRMNAVTKETTRPFFSEVELAILIDIGKDSIDLKKHFGQSYYLSHGEITNTNGFNSDAMYGVGLHVVAENNNVTQAANINASGQYATGIYSEGNKNAIVINPGVTVSATGDGGIGVLFTCQEDYERNENGSSKESGGAYVTKSNKAISLTNMGTIQTGNGYGVCVTKSLDMINNAGTIASNSTAALIARGGKVKNFNLSGNSQITGDIVAAKGYTIAEIPKNIYSPSSITNINVMGNSQITGNIIAEKGDIESGLDDGSIKHLNFGKIANADGTPGTENDPSFNGTVNGNITATMATMNVYGGALKLTGVTQVDKLTVGTENGINATVDGNSSGSIIVDNKLNNYGTVQNFNSIESSDLDNYGNTNNVTTVDVANKIINKSSGSMSNVTTITSTDFNNYGNLSNVSTVNVSNTFANKSNGDMTNVSTVNSNDFQNDGNINVGETGSIDTMNVNGAMKNSDGTLTFDANLQATAPVSGTTDDLLAIKKNGSAGADDGKLIIDGGQVNINELNSTGSSYYRADINHNIIETEEGVEVIQELKAKETGFDIPLFKPVIGHDDKNVWVGLQRDFLYGPAAQTENQEALGYYLDEIGKTPNPDGDLFPVLLQLDSLNADKETGIVSERALLALDEMSGAIYGTVPSLVNHHSTMINNSLAKHLRDWSPCNVMVNNWFVWGEAYGMGGNAKHDGNAHGYNYSVGGALFGIDRQFNIDGHIGVYFAVGSTNANVKGFSESADSTDIFAGLYFNYKDSFGWYTTMFAGFGYSDYDVERHFMFIPRNNKSSFNSKLVNAYLERGKNYSISDVWVFQPFGGLQFISSDRGAIQEQGADLLDLTVAGASMKSLRSLFGVKLATVNCVTGRKLNGEISAAWMHEFLDTSSIVSAQMSNPGGTYFESSPTFAVRGHNDGRDWFVAGLGLNYAFTDYFKLFGGYDCMVNGVGSMHRGNLGLEIKR